MAQPVEMPVTRQVKSHVCIAKKLQKFDRTVIADLIRLLHVHRTQGVLYHVTKSNNIMI